MLNNPQTDAYNRESLATIIRVVLETMQKKSKNTQLNDICVFTGRFFLKKCLQKSL